MLMTKFSLAILTVINDNNIETPSNVLSVSQIGIYDAHAYKEMGEEEQGLYDKLVRAIHELETKCKDDDASKINRDGILLADGRNRDVFLIRNCMVM